MAMPCSPHIATIFRFFVEKGEITCLGLVTLETTSCDQENLRSILIIHNNVERGEVIREWQQERFQRHSSLTGKIMSAFISKKACHLNKKRGERSPLSPLTDLFVACQFLFRTRSFTYFFFSHLRNDSANVAKDSRNGITNTYPVTALRWCLTRLLWFNIL